VPENATYRIKAVGAWGAMSAGTGNSYRGGGASIQGDFILNQGDLLDMVVGQAGIQNTSGNENNGGGASGGGSFVWVVNAGQPLIAAGGGGGGSIINGSGPQNHVGRDGVTSTQGGRSAATGYTNYGTNGGDGQYNNGGQPRGWNSMRGSLDFRGSSGNYDGIGGFGGGGGGGGVGPNHAGDGGGGYSGGAAGQFGVNNGGNADGRNGGGGGGSYPGGANQVNSGNGIGSGNRGDGFIQITRI
jgi:hypothetical protein